MSNVKYNVYDKDRELLKSDCEFIAVIHKDVVLSPQEVYRYYGVRPSHPHYHKHKGPHRTRKLVFDKCVVASDVSIIETTEGDRVRL